MANISQPLQSGNADQSWKREAFTLAIRLAFFALTIVPLGALLMPWVTLDGTRETHSGIETIALPASPIGEYLFEVAPLQAANLIVGTAFIAILAMKTAYNYHRRRSIYWAPPVMLTLALAVAFGTGELVNATHAGLSIIIAVATLLTLHQTLIRVQVALGRKGKMPKVHRVLGTVAGTGHYRWRNA